MKWNGAAPFGGVLNDPFPAGPSDAMLYSYRVFGCREVSDVFSTRSEGEARTFPEAVFRLTSSLWTSHAIFAVLPVTLTTNGPPTSFSAADISWPDAARIRIAERINMGRVMPSIVALLWVKTQRHRAHRGTEARPRFFKRASVPLCALCLCVLLRIPVEAGNRNLAVGFGAVQPSDHGFLGRADCGFRIRLEDKAGL